MNPTANGDMSTQASSMNQVIESWHLRAKTLSVQCLEISEKWLYVETSANSSVLVSTCVDNPNPSHIFAGKPGLMFHVGLSLTSHTCPPVMIHLFPIDGDGDPSISGRPCIGHRALS
jgi:hypothetical protein